MSVNIPQNYNPREESFAALFKLTSAAAKYTTISRKLRLWGETKKEERPCLFQHEMDDDVQGGDGGVPQIILMHANLFIYTWAKEHPNPSALLNPLIDSVFKALRPTNLQTGKNNLGLPYIDHCWIKGKIFKDPGDLDGDGLAIIPVVIRMGAALTFQTP